MSVLILKKLRTLMAFALMFWCAGAGCMLVSYAHTMSMSEASATQATSTKHHPATPATSMNSHSCCKAKHRSSNPAAAKEDQASSEAVSQLDDGQIALAETPARSDVMSCCPLTTRSFVTASRTSGDEANSAALAQNHSPPFELSNLQPEPLAIPLRLPDAEHTYLRCCVFLI